MAGNFTVVAEGVSKRYPAKPGRLYPPVVSIFQRKYFTRSPDDERKTAPAIIMGVVDDVDDLDDDDLDDDEFDEPEREPEPEPQAGEWIWALKDVSFELQAGQGLGLVGGPRAGKTTLLRIIGGRAFPTEGRVLVRDRVSPPPANFAASIGISGGGTFSPSIVLGSALAGYGRRIVRNHKDEINELGQLGLSEEDKERQGLWLHRLALAANIILPANVILIERLPELSDPFTQEVIERARQRMRDGASLIIASRTTEVMQDLCDDVLVLDGGVVADRGPAHRDRDSTANRHNGCVPSADRHAPARDISDSHPIAALVSAEIKNETARRPAKRRVRVEHDLLIELRLETRVPAVEVRCGMDFTAHKGDLLVRLELPEPVRFDHPGTYVLTARADPGTLRPSTVYQLRADAVVQHPGEREPILIAREAGRISVVGGDGPTALDRGMETVPHWSGGTAMRAVSEWSIR